MMRVLLFLTSVIVAANTLGVRQRHFRHPNQPEVPSPVVYRSMPHPATGDHWRTERISRGHSSYSRAPQEYPASGGMYEVPQEMYAAEEVEEASGSDLLDDEMLEYTNPTVLRRHPQVSSHQKHPPQDALRARLKELKRQRKQTVQDMFGQIKSKAKEFGSKMAGIKSGIAEKWNFFTGKVKRKVLQPKKKLHRDHRYRRTKNRH